MKSRVFNDWIWPFISAVVRQRVWLRSGCLRLIAVVSIVFTSSISAATVIDVTTYGAIPNDSLDDSAAIQAAIDAAPENSTVYFPQGTYLLSNVQINYRRGLTLTGDGATLTILKRSGRYSNIFMSTGSTDIVITNLGFDTNGVSRFGGVSFRDAKSITITKNHYFDSNKQPVTGYDRFSFVFGRGTVPSEDILITDNLIEDLQLEVDFGTRVRIEGNTIVRPVKTAGIGVFSVEDNTTAFDYTIQNNTIVDPVVSGGGIAVALDPPSTSYTSMTKFRIIDNNVVYTKYVGDDHAGAIRIGTMNMTQATTGNVFDDIIVQGNRIYKDPASAADFGNVEAIIYGNSSPVANFKFDNTKIINNQIYYHPYGLPNVNVRQKGINYVESNNLTYAISSDMMPAWDAPPGSVPPTPNPDPDPLGQPTLTVNATSIPAGGQLTATWSGIAEPTSTDWMGLYKPGAPGSSHVHWVYVSCSQTSGQQRPSGSCGFAIPAWLPDGRYELRLFANDGYTTLATADAFTVGFE